MNPTNWPQGRALLKFEREAFHKGFQNIAGVDEVGRGSLAGPVVAACVILPWQRPLPDIQDSKKLSPKQREELYGFIIQEAVGYGIGIVESSEIDRINILKASLKAMALAIQRLTIKPDCVLIDGNQKIPALDIPQNPICKGDSLSLTIAAASIVAKVTRDCMMAALQTEFPHFSFKNHKGYGTKRHFEELKRFGPTALHRLTFRGVLAKNSFTDLLRS